MGWTDERIAFLKEKWNDNWSAAQIGAALGVTRNAVIGKINRIQNGLGTKPRFKKQKFVTIKPPLPEPTPIVGGISFFDLTSTSCRWPVGNSCYCGVTTKVQPYCAVHKRMSVRAA